MAVKAQDAVVRTGAGGGPGAAAAARLCALQCLQHGCISWHKVYMGEEGSGSGMAPRSVPAAAAECLAQCGVAEHEAGCLAQVGSRGPCLDACAGAWLCCSHTPNAGR